MSSPNEPSSLIIDIKGLYLNPSTFGDNAPNGSLTVADNVIIDRPSVVESRRGFDNSFSTIATSARFQYQFATTKLLHGTNDVLYRDITGDGTYVAFSGTYPVPEPTLLQSKIRSVESNKSFYFITNNGTYKIDNAVNEPRLAGAPAGLDGIAVASGTSGFLPTMSRVAYRIVFGYKDSNDQLTLGAPSGRIIATNGSGTSQNVDFTVIIPQEIQDAPSSFFYQVYRSTASTGLYTIPPDDMSLAYEANCDGSPTQTFTDIVPDNLLGAALYTNQGQDGILQSNYRPPWAYDTCLFKQYTFYANTRLAHTANLTLIAAGASNGTNALVPGDTITFTGNEIGAPTFDLIADTVNDPVLGKFEVSDTGNPAYDIQVTASNMVLIANSLSFNTFLIAKYISGDADLPGQMSFTRNSLTTDSFTITASNENAFEQAIPITSINESRPNRIYYSKFNQPDAVPIVNYVDVGSANKKINRIVPLRDGVMVLKQDGVFRISNAAPPFTITPIDYNVKILADNTAAELDNKVYFLSDQGVVSLSDTNAQIMSFVLDKVIIQNTSQSQFPNLQETAWGIAYQSDRKYILAMPTSISDTQATQQYVYNHLTTLWTRWTRHSTCGLVFNGDGKLYLGSNVGSAPGDGNSYVYKERKDFTISDYADDQFTTSLLTNGYTDTITINNVPLPLDQTIEVGWTVKQQNTGNAIITNVAYDGDTTILTVDNKYVWDIEQNVVIYQPIDCKVKTIQLDCQDPGQNKQFSEMVYMFTVQDFNSIEVSITADTTQSPQTDELTPQINNGWGALPWGVGPWGGGRLGQGKIRRYVPQNIQRAGWIYITLSNSECFSTFGWSGVELFYHKTSTRQR